MSLKNIPLLNLEPEQEEQIRGLFTGAVLPESLPRTGQWVFRLPSEPELVLEACNEILDGYGVDFLETGAGSAADVAYVSMGDFETPTVMYDFRNEQWKIESLNDLMEREPERFRPHD